MMRNSYKKSVLFVLLLTTVNSFAQNTKRVLFLGNSYTSINNLPQLTASVAASAGKTLIFDTHAPGSYYIAGHLTNATSLAKIQSGNWDNVVLQDQSMSMAYPGRAAGWMPYYVKIDSIIKAHSPCVQTMLYSTWGRKNGDQYVCMPPQCETKTLIVRTYFEMDVAIETNYKIIADSIKSSMTPVGATWRYIRQNYPWIELHQPDESHATYAGAYAAACAFYATIFRSDPMMITYGTGLSAANAEYIRTAAKNVVYDHLLDWNVGRYDDLLDDGCLSLAVDENVPGGYWSVAPNPVADVLSVQFSANTVNDKISIYNVLGILMREIEVTQTTNIDFSSFSSGLYIIKSMNNPKTFKVLKK